MASTGTSHHSTHITAQTYNSTSTLDYSQLESDDQVRPKETEFCFRPRGLRPGNSILFPTRISNQLAGVMTRSGNVFTISLKT
jgi:hypothetical protein